jgi:hypothetical protein
LKSIQHILIKFTNIFILKPDTNEININIVSTDAININEINNNHIAYNNNNQMIPNNNIVNQNNNNTVNNNTENIDLNQTIIEPRTDLSLLRERDYNEAQRRHSSLILYTEAEIKRLNNEQNNINEVVPQRPRPHLPNELCHYICYQVNINMTTLYFTKI